MSFSSESRGAKSLLNCGPNSRAPFYTEHPKWRSHFLLFAFLESWARDFWDFLGDKNLCTLFEPRDRRRVCCALFSQKGDRTTRVRVNRLNPRALWCVNNIPALVLAWPQVKLGVGQFHEKLVLKTILNVDKTEFCFCEMNFSMEQKFDVGKICIQN